MEDEDDAGLLQSQQRRTIVSDEARFAALRGKPADTIWRGRANLLQDEPTFSQELPVRGTLNLTENLMVFVDANGRPTENLEFETVVSIISSGAVDSVGSLERRYGDMPPARKQRLMLEPTRIFGCYWTPVCRQWVASIRGSYGDPAHYREQPHREGEAHDNLVTSDMYDEFAEEMALIERDRTGGRDARSRSSADSIPAVGAPRTPQSTSRP